MKNVIMYIFRDKFTDGFISFFEKYFSEKYNFVFYTNKNDDYRLTHHLVKVIEVEKFMDIFCLKSNIEMLNYCDAFIVSGLFVHINHAYRFDTKLLEKTWIQFWGGDYKCFKFKYFLKDPKGYMIRHRRLRLIRHCAGWIELIQGESNEISKCTWIKKKSFTAPVTNPLLCEKYSYKIREKETNAEAVVVLLGNNASPENYHEKIIKRISHLANDNIKIICPLSYGGTIKYKNKIINLGKKYFCNNFIPLTEFLPVDEYYKLLLSVDVAIFNNKSQQAIGNIEELLRKGKKVYLRTTTPMWNWYISRGQRIYDVNSLRNISIENLAYFPAKYAEQNIMADLKIRQNKYAIKAWDYVLREITCSDKN